MKRDSAKRDAAATREAVFHAAADLFSRRGFGAVTVDEIARAAGVNRAMLYYHFADKLALYRAIVSRMLDETIARIETLGSEPRPPAEKIELFVASFVELAESHPYFPPLMLREIAEGAMNLDEEILARMRTVFLMFVRVLDEGHQAGVFREVNPVLAYMSTIAPVLLNAARERAAQQPGRAQFPMFVPVPHDELTRHMTRVAVQMLEKDE